MADYAVKVSVRNNRILRALREAGYKSQSDFCDKTGFPYGTLSDFIGMRRKAILNDEQWSKPAEVLALLLGKDVETLFTARQASSLKTNAVEIEMTEAQVGGILGQSNTIEALEAKQEIGVLISYLTDREQSIINQRMEGATYRELASTFGVSLERIRGIEQSAMRKMRIRKYKSDRAANDGTPLSIVFR